MEMTSAIETVRQYEDKPLLCPLWRSGVDFQVVSLSTHYS
jgi:hypothetical protein